MSTLLLRLAAPLQAWGSESKFDTRQTEKEPTKSGVVGMLAAALGLRRDADIGRLSALRFGVRTDRDGRLMRDFHMVHSAKDSYLTYRYYLCDAVFLAGLESDDAAFLQTLSDALQSPAYPLYLGRRSCPTTLPLVLGIRECPLLEALKAEAPLCKPSKSMNTLRIVYDAGEDGSVQSRRQDAPLSFDFARRLYGYRMVAQDCAAVLPSEENATEHDIMKEL